MNDLQLITTFSTSLAIGLLIGLERERHPGSKAGLRTFALVALMGTVSAILIEKTGAGWILAAGVLGLAAMMVSANWRGEGTPDDPGTTTTVAVILCYLLGALLWYGHTHLVVALALTMTALLYFKTELEGVTHRLSHQDLVSFLQFAVISLIVLPLLPDQGYGPYGALNPFQIWLMVVLISGVSLAGYVALRFAGEQRGTLLVGLLGGVVSSTATTLVYARQVRAKTAPVDNAAVIILMANLVLLLRISLISGAVAPGVLPQLLPILGGGLLIGLVATAYQWRQRTPGSAPKALEMSNPIELRTALGFGLIFALVLLAMAWMNDRAGALGVYTLAAVSGLTDMDAISLSLMQMFKQGQIPVTEACAAVVIACTANLIFKLALVVGIAGRKLALRVAPGFLGMAAGLGLTVWLTV